MHQLSDSKLSLENVFHHLVEQVYDLLPRFVDRPANGRYAGVWSPSYGMVDPKQTGHFIITGGYLLLAAERLESTIPGIDEDDLLARLAAASAALISAQREGGLIDLLSVNYDSGPDTAFTVQELCTLFELGEQAPRLRATDGWQRLLERLEQFIRRATPGIRDGGFHTPNHRWVIVSALLQAKALFPDLAIQPAVDDYLAEGFDIDDEGFFIERSIGVYDAVNDRSLLMIGEFGEDVINCGTDAYDAVARNLALDLHLIHADATAETGISRRQDYGTRQVPLALAHCYLLSHRVKADERFVRAAQTLWARSDGHSETRNWLTYALLKCGAPAAVDAPMPDDFSLLLPGNGLWRLRRNNLSVSAFHDASRLLTCVHGQAELTSVKISQTYFGHSTGHFIADTLTEADGAIVLHSEGRTNPRRPGYELPLGRPVPPETWSTTMAERELRWLPHPISELALSEHRDSAGIGLALRYQTLDGLDGVAVQIAFDFPPGGIWETNDTRTQPVAGQVLFLKRGYGTMRYGNDAIRIGPGAIAHGMWQMRDTELAPDHVRVLITFLTPVDHSFVVIGE